MARKTFTELLSGKRYDQLLDELNHVLYVREEIEQGHMTEWRPYAKWLELYHRAVAAALKNDWQGVSIFGAFANCERYPEHLKTTLLCDI